MRKNVPPAHFGYMASGIDDEVTLRANREGFLKFQLRPRRLVDVSKVDMSVDILGVKYAQPDHHRADRRPQAPFHADGEIGVARAAKTGNHLHDPLDRATTSIEDVDRRRAAAPIWYPALRHQQVGGRQGHARAPRRPDAGGRRDGRPQRRPQPGDPVPAAAAPTRASAPTATTAAASWRAQQRKPMYRGLDLTGLSNIQSLRHDLGLHQAAARRHQDEDRAQGHPGLGGRRARGRQRHRRASSCPTTAGAPTTPAARPSTRCRRSSRRSTGACRSWSTAASAAAPTSSRRCAWARRARVRRPALPLGTGRLRPARRRAGARAACASSCAPPCSRSARPSLKQLVPAMVRRA